MNKIIFGVWHCNNKIWCVNGEKVSIKEAKKSYNYFVKNFSSYKYKIMRHQYNCEIMESKCCFPQSLLDKTEIEELIKALEL